MEQLKQWMALVLVLLMGMCAGSVVLDACAQIYANEIGPKSGGVLKLCADDKGSAICVGTNHISFMSVGEVGPYTNAMWGTSTSIQYSVNGVVKSLP